MIAELKEHLREEVVVLRGPENVSDLFPKGHTFQYFCGELRYRFPIGQLPLEGIISYCPIPLRHHCDRCCNHRGKCPQ